MEHLNGIPTCWPIPKVETAYVLDFNKDARISKDAETLKGKPKGLDSFLKAEVSDYHINLTSSDSDVVTIESRFMGKRDKWQYISGSIIDTSGWNSCSSFNPPV